MLSLSDHILTAMSIAVLVVTDKCRSKATEGAELADSDRLRRKIWYNNIVRYDSPSLCAHSARGISSVPGL